MAKANQFEPDGEITTFVSNLINLDRLEKRLFSFRSIMNGGIANEIKKINLQNKSAMCEMPL